MTTFDPKTRAALETYAEEKTDFSDLVKQLTPAEGADGIDPALAVHLLELLDDGEDDDEARHGIGDEILLMAAPPAVRAAHRHLMENSAWWACG